MAKGDFYFPVFYQRLLTSTSGWKDDEFGCYFRLLIHQFDKGSIPDDINKLTRIAPSVKKHWEALIKEKFVSDGKGCLINEVMHEIRNEVQLMREKNKENGKKGGRPRKNHPVNSGKPNGFKNETQPITQPITQTKAIPITNNQYPNKERDAGHENKGSLIYNAEEVILANAIQFERIIMSAGSTKEIATQALHRYHLYLEEKEQYPKTRKAVFAGFERWLIGEKKFNPEVNQGTNEEKQMVF